MPKTLQVRFENDYKNGMLGLDVGAGDVVELTEPVYEQVCADVRYPYDSLQLVGESLASLSVDELTEMANELGVMPESGSGADGNVIKKDIIAAIEEAD